MRNGICLHSTPNTKLLKLEIQTTVDVENSHDYHTGTDYSHSRDIFSATYLFIQCSPSQNSINIIRIKIINFEKQFIV